MLDKNKNIAVIDVETTGTDPIRDFVIEFACQTGLERSSSREVWRIKPPIPIPKEVTKIHGISDGDVADCPSFKERAQDIKILLETADVLVGYNVRFDIDMIKQEFQRLGSPKLNLENKIIVDPLTLWRRMEPRTLSHAVRKFLGRDHDGAHSAGEDTAATAEVLKAMLVDYKLTDRSWDDLFEICEPGRTKWIGGTNHLIWQDGQVSVGFGKHRGRSLSELVTKEPAYVSWIQSKDFPPHVKQIVGASLKLAENDFSNWVCREFGAGISVSD